MPIIIMNHYNQHYHYKTIHHYHGITISHPMPQPAEALQGQRLAQRRLAERLLRDESNAAEALKWLRRAAEEDRHHGAWRGDHRGGGSGGSGPG